MFIHAFNYHFRYHLHNVTLNKKAPAASKKASELWKALSAEDRQYWDDQAAKEKDRFTSEKAAYTGIWHVPRKRAKKVRFLSANCSKN